jgi:F-type H+-transporting ATPase subunit a
LYRILDFSSRHLLVSGILGLVVFGLMASVASKATPAFRPAACRILLKWSLVWLTSRSRDTFHGKSALVTPLAITIFVWVFVMNAMDLIPVDFLPVALQAATGNHDMPFKFVPTTDPNLTFAMSITVFFISLFMGLKVKGFGHFMHEVFAVPFGLKLAPINFLFRIVEEIARPISLSLRLFGNMYAGEMVFILIALARSVSAAPGFAMGTVPHPDHHPASFCVHDADHRLHVDGC